MTLPEFSVRQTVLVNVLFVVCMVGGWNALQLTEVEYFHDVTLNQVVVTTQWTGASADEIERLVTTKLEEELLTVNAIEEMRSASQSNISMISLDIDETITSIDYESAVNDIRGALDQVSGLPDEAEEPQLREIITAEVRPVVFVAISRGAMLPFSVQRQTMIVHVHRFSGASTNSRGTCWRDAPPPGTDLRLPPM